MNLVKRKFNASTKDIGPHNHFWIRQSINEQQKQNYISDIIEIQNFLNNKNKFQAILATMTNATMNITALFTIAMMHTQSRCQSMVQRIKKIHLNKVKYKLMQKKKRKKETQGLGAVNQHPKS